MNRSDLQKIIDEIIGEATLALLIKAGPISNIALINQLKVMQEQAEQETRRQHIALAIKEVNECIAVNQGVKRKNNDEDSVVYLFPESYGGGNQRKH
ncbi:hypothetical protein QU24_15665 [Pantoea rodasii]|uniref:Uncharacterized protein n=1 Tax=Pantoea rodasii TaxID=1076549 RepID=A0A0B1R688_9GAMM|nr:hypothetical protein [Pantoea rodasii]KHJ67161.1 hypothetical protein QU24_15665 [Pantoea rodasii]